MSKRQKHVFPSSEIPHLWAHQTQGDARNSQGNLYFKGATIFSYRDSYPIASHVTSKNGKRNAILIRTDSYSVTTSGHISAVRSAIPAGVQVFNVPSVQTEWAWAEPGADHKTNLSYYVSQSKESLSKAERARKLGSYELKEAFGYRDSARSYAAFFGLTCPLFDFLPKGFALTKLKTKIAERESRARVADERRYARERARRAEQERIRTLELAEQLQLWRQGDPNVSAWQLHSASPALRIVGDNVETSKGARFPLAHACKGLKLVQASSVLTVSTSAMVTRFTLATIR